MCHFITLTTDCPDIEQLKAVMRRIDRTVRPQSNPSIQRLLKKGEAQYSTARGCDCGTVLGRRGAPAEPRDVSKLIERKRKSGWSKAKIERWLTAGREPGARGRKHELDSFDFWQKTIADILALEGTTTAGVIVHEYSGSLNDERFTATRHEIGMGGEVAGALKMLGEDELLIIKRSHGRNK